MKDRTNLRNLETSEVLKEGQNLYDQLPFISSVNYIIERYQPLPKAENGKLVVRRAISEISHSVCNDLETSFGLLNLQPARALKILYVEISQMDNATLHRFVESMWRTKPDSQDLPSLRARGLDVFHELADRLKDDQGSFVYAYGLTGFNKPFIKQGQPSQNFGQRKKSPVPTFEVWNRFLALSAS